jgi:hypothetical protein
MPVSKTIAIVGLAFFSVKAEGMPFVARATLSNEIKEHKVYS